MTIIRKTTHVVMLALSLQVVYDLNASQGAARTANFWDRVSGWFSHQVKEAEKVANKVGNEVEQAAERVGKKMHVAAHKAKRRVKSEAGSMADRIVEPIVERAGEHVKRHIEPVIKKGVKHVERHAKPVIQRVIKETVDQVEKQAEPMIARTEKRIQQNIARTVKEYCLAGLGGIAGFIIVRKSATALVSKEPGAFGKWLRRQDESSSALVSDVLIGAMIGMGIYGLSQIDEPVEAAPAAK